MLLFRKGERSGERIDLAEHMDMMALCGVLDDGISDLNFLLGVLKVLGSASVALAVWQRPNLSFPRHGLS
jgi:hypothetical protein